MRLRPSRGYHPRPECDRRGLGRRRSRLRFAGSSRIGASSSRRGKRQARGGRNDRSAERATYQDRLNLRSEEDCRRSPNSSGTSSGAFPSSDRRKLASPRGSKTCQKEVWREICRGGRKRRVNPQSEGIAVELMIFSFLNPLEPSPRTFSAEGLQIFIEQN